MLVLLETPPRRGDTDCWFNAGKFIYVVYVFSAGMEHHAAAYVLASDWCRVNLIHAVDAVMSARMIQEEGVCVFVCDNIGDGDAPKFCSWASPAFKNCRLGDDNRGGARVIEIYFLSIVDHCVACFNKFVGAEE